MSRTLKEKVEEILADCLTVFGCVSILSMASCEAVNYSTSNQKYAAVAEIAELAVENAKLVRSLQCGQAQ